jgi:tight adherence protein C
MRENTKQNQSDHGWWTIASLEQAIPLVKRLRNSTEHARRSSEGLRDLPEMLDILTLGLSAGLSFDASLELYCERSKKGLSVALRAALESWRMGISTRDEALQAVADDLALAALRRFADAVSQALAFGSPLAAVLEQQAQAIRDEQRSQVEEQIEKVPVKMLIPLGTLIVPAMLRAVLGPLLGASLALG